MLGFRVSLRLYCQVKAKFHYTDTDTDFFCGETPLGPCGSVLAKFHYTDTDTDTDFFAAKRTRTDPTEFRRKKVRVRVRDGPVSVSV